MTGQSVLRAFGWILGAGACVAAIYIAAGAALERPSVLRIHAAVASGPTADYSADDPEASRPALDPRILGAIVSDDSSVDAAAAQTRDVPLASTPTPRPAAIPTERPQATQIPAPTDTPEPTPTDTPESKPTPTDTPEPEPTPTDTPKPEPTATNTPKPEPTPTATPRRCRLLEPIIGQGEGNGGENNGKRKCPTPTPEPKEGAG